MRRMLQAASRKPQGKAGATAEAKAKVKAGFPTEAFLLGMTKGG